jgi:hypothetical protein
VNVNEPVLAIESMASVVSDDRERVAKASGAYGVELTGNDCPYVAFRHVHQLEGHCSLGGWCPGDGCCAPCAEVEALRGHIERIG